MPTAQRIAWRLLSAIDPAPAVVSLRALESAPPFDVCIIGSGPAGAVLGLDLVERGRRVLMLEAGPRRPPWRPVPDEDTPSTSGAIDNYPLASSRYRGAGGTSRLWAGACPRLHPLDFQRNAYTPDGAAWPVAYADLEPHYERAEKTLRVHGGALSAHHPPRRGDLPFPPRDDNAALRTMMAAAGIAVDNSPISIGRHGRPGVRVATDLLPRFARSASAALVCGAVVTGLRLDSTGRVRAAEVRGVCGERAVAAASVFVVAAGGVETPRLLLLSRPPCAPRGVGNASGVVGRYFTEHMRVAFEGRIERRGLRGTGRSHQYYEPFKQRGLGSVILGFAAGGRILRISADIEMWPVPHNRIDLAPERRDRFGLPGLDLSLALSERDRETADHTKALIRKIYAKVGGSDVVEVTGRVSPWLSHHMGTCRMGEDPATSVTDANLRVHGSPNLFLLGSAVFVTGGAANPTLTIAALAHRLADFLCADGAP
jgi:choline dehydrogenase-like flavoprotein